MFGRKKNKESLARLVERLNKLCYSLENSCNINNGGCGFVAYCISENLSKYNIKYDVIFHGYGINTKECYKNMLNNCCRTVSHISIKVGNHRINTGSYREEMKDKGTSIGHIPYLNIREWYYEHLKQGEWNCSYDVKCNGTVHREINKIFKIYEKESGNLGNQM